MSESKEGTKKYGYKVAIRSTCHSSSHSDEQYGEWHESYSNSLESVSIGGEYPDVVSTHKLEPGEIGCLVWVEYSTGNSFGHSERGSTEAVGLFKDPKVAQELVDALHDFSSKKPNKNWDDRYKFHFETSDGQVFSYGFVPWSGYFETLEDVHLTPVIIKRK